MQYRVFAIPATGSPELEEELNHFLRSHRVVSVQKSVEVVDGAPRWCFCVEYLEGGVPLSGRSGGATGRARRVDYKEVLTEEDFAVYARLREARKELAAAEAVPVYAVCTNEQLAAMATRRPDSPAELKAIDGVGEAKVARYGEALLTVINGSRKARDETSGPAD